MEANLKTDLFKLSYILNILKVLNILNRLHTKRILSVREIIHTRECNQIIYHLSLNIQQPSHLTLAILARAVRAQSGEKDNIVTSQIGKNSIFGKI